jgi:hypothetical protein
MFSTMEYLFRTVSDMEHLVMGRFESGKFWAVGPLVSGMFSDGTFWEWDV